ncbi:amidohydrolase [Seongchinamella unica]|uniref:Amidohydrolase n=1 Tax=Seongchinamella unica TaxID=2547392 RepID=A0A4R5LS58_9GAMM|nr:amidohydrolase [Seongchinamella unica]TDG13738.1 amidohydrolase [Seongchinamella unica]
MSRFYFLGLLACLINTSALAAPASSTSLLYNVTGYSLNSGRVERFSALEFQGDTITAVYPTPEAAKASKANERIDGGGATLLPGLIDAHGHVGGYGKSLSQVDLVGVTSEKAAGARVAEVAATESKDWILGRGWNQALWPGKSFPTRESLDKVAPDQPVALVRIDGHALWVNSAALELAGIDASVSDPPGGQIIRDASGVATGVLVDNAMNLINQVIADDSDQQVVEYQRRALDKLAGYGLTSVHDARSDARSIRAYQALAEKQALAIRVYPMLDVLDAGIDPYLAAGPVIDPTHMLDIRSVKISADGALGSRGAAMIADYSDEPGHRGLLLLSDAELEHHINRAMAAGYQVNTHAIGDLANQRVLDLYQPLLAKNTAAGLRHRIEHAQVLRPQDIPRFRTLNVIASVQPTHATSDKNMAEDRVGADRLQGAYAWKSLLDAGTRMAGGSDFPVEHPNPFHGLYAAITRQGQDGEPPGGWLPEQKLSRAEALHLFTEGAAYAAHQEHLIGRLAPGYYADFILVDSDYFTMPESDIWKTRVLETWVAGRRVYGTD